MLEPEELKPKRERTSWGCASTLATIILVAVMIYALVQRFLPSVLPNNTSGGDIVYGMSVSDYIGSGERDQWVFEGEQGDIISVTMEGSFDTYIEIESSDGEQLAENDDFNGQRNSFIPAFVLPYDGSYTVVARGWSSSGSGTYTLQVQEIAEVPDTADEAIAFATEVSNFIDNSDDRLEYGDSVSGTVTTEEGDRWTFRGRSGDIITIDMMGNFDTYLVLYDSNNLELMRDDDGGEENNARIAYFVLPYNDTFTILARGWGGEMGSYDLFLESSATMPDITDTPSASRAGTIEYGQTVSGSVDDFGGDAWTFRADEGDIVSIDMTGDFDTYLLLYDSDNRQLTYDDDSGADNNASITYYTLPFDGTYTIVARGWNGRTGSYELTLRYDEFIPTATITRTSSPTPAPSEAGSIEYGQTVSGHVRDEAGESWTFRADEGDIISIDMEGDFDTYLLLYDSDNRELTRDDDSGEDNNARIAYFVLPYDGTYTIVARGWAGRTGSYELTLHYEEFIPTPTRAPTLTPTPLPTRAGSIEYGQTVSGRVRDYGGDAWTFRGEEGDEIIISMDGDFDTYLVLADNDYRQLAYDDDSGDELTSLIRNYTLPADGTYIIVARGYYGATGDYELTLEVDD